MKKIKIQIYHCASGEKVYEAVSGRKFGWVIHVQGQKTEEAAREAWRKEALARIACLEKTIKQIKEYLP